MNFLAYLPLGLAGLLGLSLAAGAADTPMYAHGLLLFGFAVAGVFWVISRDGDTGGPAVVREGGINYNDAIIRAGVVASTFWGVVGFTVGLVIALQLAFPVLNFDLPWTNFGRLRPLQRGRQRDQRRLGRLGALHRPPRRVLLLAHRRRVVAGRLAQRLLRLVPQRLPLPDQRRQIIRNPELHQHLTIALARGQMSEGVHD